MPPVTVGGRMSTIEKLRSENFDVHTPSSVEMPLRLVMATNGADGRPNEVRLYYAPDPIPIDSTLDDVINSGGIMVTQRYADGFDARSVKAEAGDRATIVLVGPYEAALIWADPFFSSSRRAFNLYWSDGTFDFLIQAGVSTADATVDAARTYYC
jgi:hypothetical protein